MALFAKIAGTDSWRLKEIATDQFVARFMNEDSIDRFIRDSTLAQAVAAALSGTRAERRAAAVAAYNDWVAAGGRVRDLSSNPSGLSMTNMGSGGTADGNRNLYVGGVHDGYFHGTVYNAERPLRFVELAEKIWEARQLGTATLRNQATDAAIDTFEANGGLD